MFCPPIFEPLNDTPPGSRFAGKSGGKTFLIRWVESGQSSRVLWCHSLALLALLGCEFCADAVHDFFETRRLIEDCRLAPIIHGDVDAAAGKTDRTFEVGHSTIHVATVLAGK